MKAAVIGYGKSGKAAEKLLRLKGYADVDVFDSNLSLGYPDITAYSGTYDETVISPGVDLRKYPNIPAAATSEIELAYKSMDKKAKIVAITGTNGKSTTTHLTAQILNACGFKAQACGNIGKPFADAVLEKGTEIFVIELSSFQIDLLNTFTANSAAVLNVTQDHLDRYGNMDAYYASKLRLLDFIRHDGVFIGDNDSKIKNCAKKNTFNSVFIDKTFDNYPKVSGDILDFGRFSVDLRKFTLFGRHNVLNLVYSLLLAEPFAKFEGDISHLLNGLTGMPHRTELVAEYNGVRYINDSKGTNVDSVVTALQSVLKPSYLLIGGRDKKSDYTTLAPLINERVSEICYFGEAAALIRAQLSHLLKCRESEFVKLEDAVAHCADKAESGAVVLLSPACTSFDEFKNYEERGVKFHDYVNKYAGGVK